jgi:hypothetical protein
MVFSEAAPHFQMWKVFPQCCAEGIDSYRKLVLAMGRHRLASYRSHFIRFTSYSVMRFAFVRAAFPDTPAVFLFRQPNAVLESSARSAQPWIGRDIGFGRIWSDPSAAYLDFCRAALDLQDPRFRCLEYPAVTPENLPSILRFFQVEPSSRELALMRSEFFWDARSGRIPLQFIRNEPSRGYADQCLADVYDELVERALSDWSRDA